MNVYKKVNCVYIVHNKCVTIQLDWNFRDIEKREKTVYVLTLTKTDRKQNEIYTNYTVIYINKNTHVQIGLDDFIHNLFKTREKILYVTFFVCKCEFLMQFFSNSINYVLNSIDPSSVHFNRITLSA